MQTGQQREIQRFPVGTEDEVRPTLASADRAHRSPFRFEVRHINPSSGVGPRQTYKQARAHPHAGKFLNEIDLEMQKSRDRNC